MWFGILGPLLVRDGETLVEAPKGRQRVLLAALLMRAGHTVPADMLAEVVWDEAPPRGAAVTLRSHVAGLRRALGPQAGARLITSYPGYLLEAGEEEVDLLRFRSLYREGSTAVKAGAWAQAHGLLGQAVDLWRGAALSDVPSGVLHRDEVPGLEELRLQAEEWRIDAALHLGLHAELVTELQSLAARNPLRELFHAQLMLALYRCGRQAEALAAYQRARDVLIIELGVEPGQGLRELHQRILSADPALTVTEPTQPVGAGPHRNTPQELPPTVPGFTGRSAELKMLTRLVEQSGEQAPGTVVISAIGGTAGVGKTALAVHWAHQRAWQFPDGQLYVNLRGYDPAQPVPADAALAGFLRSLGVPGQDIPPEADQRAARYRSLLVGKRMLIVLDNAGSADQVRPLLPGTPSCAVVVTSRDALAGLVARDGAVRLDLNVLPLADAVALLRSLIGERVDTEAEAAAELADQCCRLPLALRVAAELAAARPAMPLTALISELADLGTRLDLLAPGGDPRAQVRAVFSWSYRHLDAEAARAFRLLGLHPGPDFEPYATAALTDMRMPQAHRALDVLARSHLLSRPSSGRYGMHDLLRSYARELTAALDAGEEQHAALTRLFDHYLHSAAAAMNILFPAERERRPRTPRPATPTPPLPDPTAAREWLDRERAALVAATGYTAAHDRPDQPHRLAAPQSNPATMQTAGRGWPTHTIRLAAILFRYLESAGHYAEIVSINTHARRAASDTRNRIAEAEALNNLTIVDLQQGRYVRAGHQLEQALVLYQETGDRHGEARVLGNLGILRFQQGRYKEAIAYQQRSLKLRREGHDQVGEANTLNNRKYSEVR